MLRMASLCLLIFCLPGEVTSSQRVSAASIAVVKGGSEDRVVDLEAAGGCNEHLPWTGEWKYGRDEAQGGAKGLMGDESAQSHGQVRQYSHMVKITFCEFTISPLPDPLKCHDSSQKMDPFIQPKTVFTSPATNLGLSHPFPVA